MTLASGAASRMLARFAGRLHEGTLTRPASSAIDGNDPTAAPTGTDATFDVEGYAFAYELRDIDGTRIVKGDYRVVLLRPSVIPEPGDAVSLPPPGETVAKTARVVRIEGVTEAQVTVQVRG